jgi:DNA-binding NtrC family response regulator
MVFAAPLPMRSVAESPSNRHSQTLPVGVVIIDADPAQRRNLASIISERSAGRFAAVAFASAEEAEATVRAESVGVLIADLETIGGAARLQQMGTARTTIATSANASLTTVIAAMRAARGISWSNRSEQRC